jgi:uncharacterized protein (TIGR03643 family)
MNVTQADTLNPEWISRIIEMAWEDRTPFDAIFAQFGLTEQQTKELMRANMKSSSYKLWRKRVNGRKTKHVELRDKSVNRFKCPSQR